MIQQLQTRVGNVWHHIRTSFWFIPSLMVFAAIAAFFLFQAVDQAFPRVTFIFFGNLRPIGPEGARALLSTIAGSMVTVAGTVFSITIVALALASSQFGPRLLKTFIRSPSNQIVLGSFISCFVYCLCVLASIQPEQDTSFVPRVSVYVANLLALFNVGILIYFIHHIATSIQADQVVYNVSEALMQQLDSLLIDYGDVEITSGKQTTRKQELNTRSSVRSESWGYVQAIDFESLLALATEKDCLLELNKHPGSYVALDEALASVQAGQEPDTELLASIRRAFIIGHSRSDEQDVEFSIHQLVEVAVRALSPGVNDPNTALTCLDHLSTALSIIVRRDFPESEIGDKDGNLRLKIIPLRFDAIVDSAFNQIRQHGKGNAAILIRMVEVMGTIAGFTHSREFQQELQRHVNLVERAARRSIEEQSDLQDLEDRIRVFQATLAA